MVVGLYISTYGTDYIYRDTRANCVYAWLDPACVDISDQFPQLETEDTRKINYVLKKEDLLFLNTVWAIHVCTEQ